MSTTAMGNAFANAKAKTPAATKPTAKQPAVRLTKADMDARRLARRLSRADASKVIDETDVTRYVETSDELRAYERELTPLTKKGSTIPMDQLNSARASLEKKINECREELAVLVEEYPDTVMVTAAARREELRASARNLIQTVGLLDPTNSNREADTTLLTNAVSNGVLVKSGDLYVAAVEDPVVQEAEARVADFFDARKTAREEEQNERADKVQAYLLSDRRPKGGGDSPLETEKRKPGRVSLTRLRAGDGERSFVPVFGKNQNSGEEYFMGEALIERRDGKPTATKASRIHPCEKLFFSYNRGKDESQERGVFAIPSDLETLHPAFFREALQRQLVKDAESADRREKADLLSAVESHKDAISFADLRVGEKGRWIVNAEWTPDGRQRSSKVTYHVESDGKNFHIGEAAYNLEEVDKTFFGMYLKPTPVSVLSTDKRWLAQAALNRPFEVSWELRQAASKVGGNVTFVTKDNVANPLGLKGIDGVYAASARWQQQTKERSDAPRYVAIGYIVERRGDKVAITFATPGTAEGLIEKEQGTFPLADLPVMTRAVARAIWMAATRDFGTVPEHLKAVKSSS